MEQVELPLSEFTLRCRSVAVSHTSTTLRRGLDRGETVLASDPRTGTHCIAVVADVDFTLTDTIYRLDLGLRLSHDEAATWLAPEEDTAPGLVSTQEILDLLGELHRSRRLVRALVHDVAH